MINIKITIEQKGYNPNDLSYGSSKKVWAICDECKIGRWVNFRQYRNICLQCSRKLYPTTLGKKHSKESKEKMSKICMDKYKGKDNPFYGKYHSKESKKVMSKSSIGKHHSKETKEKISKYSKKRFKNPKNHPNYNPNLTDEDRIDRRCLPDYKEWRAAVYKRDNYTCQICSNKGRLNAHHLDGYANNKELRITLSNGITLCKECHDDFHHQYGRGNNTKEQFIEFIKNR